MKVYNLACPLSHRFEGWFASEADFIGQQEKSMLSCPVCDSTEITRLPSAPYLGVRSSKEVSQLPALVEGGAAKGHDAGNPNLANLTGLNDALKLTPEQRNEFQEKMQSTMLKVVREIMTKTEDVGDSFPEEARKIHYQEAPERSIRGVATPDQAAELIEEGIEVFSLPMTTALKSTLQ
jgi:hypothetical protein